LIYNVKKLKIVEKMEKLSNFKPLYLKEIELKDHEDIVKTPWVTCPVTTQTSKRTNLRINAWLDYSHTLMV